MPLIVVIGAIALAAFGIWGLFLALRPGKPESASEKSSHYESRTGYGGGGGR